MIKQLQQKRKIVISFLATAFLIPLQLFSQCSPAPAFNDTYYYSAYFQKENKNELFKGGQTIAQFQTWWKANIANGYRIGALETHYEGSVYYITATMKKATNAERWAVGYSQDDFKTYYSNSTRDGYRIDQLSIINTPGGLRYAGLFKKSTEEEYIIFQATWSQLNDYYHNKMKPLGFSYHILNAYITPTGSMYTAVFRLQKNNQYIVYDQLYYDYKDKIQPYLDNGYRFRTRDVKKGLNGSLYYNVVLEQTYVTQYKITNLTAASFWKSYNDLLCSGEFNTLHFDRYPSGYINREDAETDSTINPDIADNNFERASSDDFEILPNPDYTNNSFAQGYFQVAPNPSTGIFQITGEIPVSQNLNVKVVSMDGRIIHQENIDAGEGQYNFRIDISDQPSAMYLLKVESPETNITQYLKKD